MRPTLRKSETVGRDRPGAGSQEHAYSACGPAAAKVFRESIGPRASLVVSEFSSQVCVPAGKHTGGRNERFPG